MEHMRPCVLPLPYFRQAHTDTLLANGCLTVSPNSSGLHCFEVAWDAFSQQLNSNLLQCMGGIGLLCEDNLPASTRFLGVFHWAGLLLLGMAAAPPPARIQWEMERCGLAQKCNTFHQLLPERCVNPYGCYRASRWPLVSWWTVVTSV